MDFDHRTGQRDHCDPRPDDLLLLSSCKDPIQDPGLRPAIHARIKRMPIPKARRQAPPLTPMLYNVQKRGQHCPIGYFDVPALPREQVLELPILLLGKLPLENITNLV